MAKTVVLMRTADVARLGELARALAQRRTDLVALGGILLFALVIRLVWLESLPPNVTADEADTLQTVYHILSGTGPGLFGTDWTHLPAVSSYLIAAVLAVAGYSITALRLTSVLFSVAALVPFYFLARRVTGPTAALIAALLLSANAWYLNFSRAGWLNVWVAVFALAAMLFLQRGLDRGRMRDFALAGAFCALCLYGYFAGRLVLPALLLSLPFALLQKRQPARTLLAGYALMAAVALVLFEPQSVSLLQSGDLVDRRTESVSIFAADTTPSGVLRLMLAKTAASLRAFVLLDPTVSYNLRYVEAGSAVLDPITGIAYVAGLAFALRRGREVLLWWLMLGVGLFLPQILTRGPINGGRAVAFAPIVYLFVALAIAEVLRRPSLLPLRFALVLLVPLVVHTTFTDYVDWMQSPTLAQVRQPAVEVSEFAIWQDLQLSEAREGRRGFNVDEWHERRPIALKRPIGTPVPLPPEEVPVLSADEGSSAPRVGRVTATLGAMPPDDRVREPHGVAVDRAGNVYVADTGNARILKFDPSGKRIAQWGGRGTGEGQFEEPFDLVVDSRDRVFVLDSLRGVIQRFSAQGVYQATLLGDEDAYRPRGLTLAADNLLYVADTGRDRILQVSTDGALLRTWEKDPQVDLHQPTDVVVDAQGNLYVAEPDAERIQKLDPNGFSVARRELARSSTRDAAHLALLPNGQIVVTDPGGGRVGVLDADLSWVATLEAEGLSWPGPVGVATTRAGEVWVADAARSLVVRVTTTR